MPWFKPTNTRVAPPATGEFGTADPYYNSTPAQPPGTSAPATRQGKSGSTRSVSSTDAAELEGDTELAWTSPKRIIQREPSDSETDRYGATIRRVSNSEQNSQVRQADYETSEDYAPGSTRSRKRVEFKGMPVNDATGATADAESDDSGAANSGSWKRR
jgi:hypothetical protein